MKKNVAVATLILLLGLCTSSTYAGEVAIFGPKKYLRTKGKPNRYANTFIGKLIKSRIIIKNGDARGKYRVSSAVIKINDKVVLGPNKFNKKVYNLEAPVYHNVYNSFNTISVELRSKPGSYLTIQIVQFDNDPPIPDIDPLPAVTGECSATITTAPTATDVFAGIVTGTTTDPLFYSEQGTHTITWTYDDGNGNTSTQTQTVIVDDVTPPVPDVDQLPLIEGQGSIVISTIPTATDNCIGTVQATTTDSLEYSALGEYTVTWTYDDGNGNVKTQQQTIRVIDSIPPLPDIDPLPQVSGECSASVTPPPTATDAVTGPITGTTSDPLTYTKQGTHTITWTYDDGNGNSSTQIQTVIVDDVTAPVPDVDPLPVIEGQGSVVISTIPTATDNCVGTIEGTTNSLEYSTPGEYTISWQYNDGNGNVATQPMTVIVTEVADQVSPIVNIIAPSQAQVSESIIIEALANDNVGVVKVSFYIDGLHVKDFDSQPYQLTYSAPGEAGKTLTINIKAFDEEGNQGEADALITVVALPDTNLPEIVSIVMPPEAAPGDSVTVRAEVTDDRGVALVQFSHQGTTLGTITNPPYEATFIIPQDAFIGSTYIVNVEAQDNGGNTATNQKSLTVVSNSDTIPPSSVNLRAPENSITGQTIQLTAIAEDNVGLLKVMFYADGVLIGDDIDSPYQFPYTIPDSKEVGKQVIFQARAVDFSNNYTDSPKSYTQIITPIQGYLIGEVYDDTTGLPVVGAKVKVINSRGKPLEQPMETFTDSRGRYRFLLLEGDAILKIEKSDHTSSYRKEHVFPEAVTNALDVRLTPLGSGQSINHLTGGNILVSDHQISLYVAPGTFIDNRVVTLDVLSGQGLPAPLPPGWAPVSTVNIGPESLVPNTTMELTIRELEDINQLISVFWDSQDHRWVRIGTSILPEENGLFIPLKKMGVIALVRPDIQPSEPLMPDVGGALSGVVSESIPLGTEADILPNPKILFMQPGINSDVWVALNNSQPLPSGTRVEVDFNELYERTGSRWVIPEPMTQDIILFQTRTGFEGHFVASPSEIFDPVLLKEGLITLTAHQHKESDGSGIIGPEGGTVTSSGGCSITIAPNALQSPTPVLLNSIVNPDPVLYGDSRFEFLKGVDVDLGGEILSESASLTLNFQTTLAQDAQVLVVRSKKIEGITRYELVGIASVEGNILSVTSGALGLPLTGILQGGRYHFLHMLEPVGYVTGTIQFSGGPVGNGLASGDKLPFISLISASSSDYVLASTLTEMIITGKNLIGGDSASDSVTLDAKNQVFVLNLVLSSSRPTVASVVPAAGATEVHTATAITVEFSREMDGTTINPSTFIINDGAAEVEGTVTLLPNKTTAVFQPIVPLDDSTLYQISLSTTVQDSFEQPLYGNQPDETFKSTFTTVDITPPARPEAGQISIEFSDLDVLSFSGTQGSAEPGVIVTAINDVTGETVSVTADPDGSFSLNISAKPGEKVELTYSDNTGNQTSVPVEIPVVAEQLDVSPASILFIDLSDEQLLTVKATYSDGSISTLPPQEITFESTDNTIVTVSPEGVITPIADGDASVVVSYGDPPYIVTENVPVSVVAIGVSIVDQEVGPGGAEIELDDGFRLSIPQGALDSTEKISVEKLSIENPVMVYKYDGNPVKIIHGYRFSPNLQFNEPVTIEFPYDGALLDLLGEDDELMVYTSKLSSLDSIYIDGFPEDDDSSPSQHNDRLNHRIIVDTYHFSYKYLAQLGNVPAGNPDLFLDYNDVVVEAYNIPGVRQAGQIPPGIPNNAVLNNKADNNRNIVLHATNSKVELNVRFVFPDATWNGQRFRFSLEGEPLASNATGQDTGFRFNAGVAQTNKTVRVRNRRIRETILTGSATRIALTVRPDVGPQVWLHTFTLQNPSTPIVVPPVTLPWLTANVTASIDVNSQTGVINYLQNPGLKNDGTPDMKSVHYIINSRGQIIQYYDPDLLANHAPGRNSHSIGIEILNTGHSMDFYTGFQIDGVLQLCDYLMNQYQDNILVNDRGSARKPDSIATTYNVLNRASPFTDADINIAATRAVITHREVERDYNNNLAGHSNGTRWRKPDPYGPTFDVYPEGPPKDPDLVTAGIESVTAGLSYDFPGLINVSGGDVKVAYNPNAARKGGNVTIKYGFFTEDPTTTIDVGGEITNTDRNEMEPDDFAGIPDSVRRDETVSVVGVDKGDSMEWQAATGQTTYTKDDIANLIIKGTLILKSDTTLHVSGTTYLAPSGRVIGRKNDGNGVNLTIYSAGPVILQGLVDLSGADSPAGHGGNLKILSRAKSPLQIPAIITRGGDVATLPTDGDPTNGKGGKGGNVTIQGPPKGLIVFSGLKNIPTAPIRCDYGSSIPEDGFKMPINSTPRVAPLYESSYSKTPCDNLYEYNPNLGLTRTQGRGIITSGGMGASAQSNSDSIMKGSNGGDGGNITIYFPENRAGVIRLRDVSFITGPGTGMIKTKIPVVYVYEKDPMMNQPFLLLAGSAGGKGNAGKDYHIISKSQFCINECVSQFSGACPLTQISYCQSLGGTYTIAKRGGDGGNGGQAGNIEIDNQSKIFPQPNGIDTVKVLWGHDSGIPKDEPLIEIGKVVIFYNGTSPTDPGRINLLTILVINDNLVTEYPNVLVGGCGGVAGGSILNHLPGTDDLSRFKRDGTAGRFGLKGESGSVDLPVSLINLLSTL